MQLGSRSFRNENIYFIGTPATSFQKNISALRPLHNSRSSGQHQSFHCQRGYSKSVFACLVRGGDYIMCCPCYKRKAKEIRGSVLRSYTGYSIIDIRTWCCQITGMCSALGLNLLTFVDNLPREWQEFQGLYSSQTDRH